MSRLQRPSPLPLPSRLASPPPPSCRRPLLYHRRLRWLRACPSLQGPTSPPRPARPPPKSLGSLGGPIMCSASSRGSGAAIAAPLTVRPLQTTLALKLLLKTSPQWFHDLVTRAQPLTARPSPPVPRPTKSCSPFAWSTSPCLLGLGVVSSLMLRRNRTRRAGSTSSPFQNACSWPLLALAADSRSSSLRLISCTKGSSCGQTSGRIYGRP